MIINKHTKLYGSFSNNPGNNGCIFFNTEFEKRGINSIYKSFYSTDIKNLIISVRHLNFSGFALSMPLKIEILDYLDIIDSTAKEIGAVNTVINNNGVLIGCNTDWIGVKKYLTSDFYIPRPISKKIDDRQYRVDDHITILGNGGFSKAVQYACKDLNMTYDIITRENWGDIKNIDKNDMVFNATPIDIETNAILIDGRPFTEQGKQIANFQAAEQFYLYTGIKI